MCSFIQSPSKQMGSSDGPDAKARLHAGYQFAPWLFTMQSTGAHDRLMGHLLFTYFQPPTFFA